MTRRRDTRCPWCFKRNDAHSAVVKRGEVTEEPLPTDESVGFCVYCGQPAIFDSTARGNMRFPTREEYEEIKSDEIAGRMVMMLAKRPDLVTRTIRRRPDWM